MDRFADNPLARAVRAALSPDLLKPEWRDAPPPYGGHCYVATEAYYFLAGAARSGLRPTVIRHEGTTHWFLLDAAGAVTDLTLEQFRTPVPYAQGRGCGLQNKDQTVPSKRAQVVIDRVRAVDRRLDRRAA